jgi:hypothetical protein
MRRMTGFVQLMSRIEAFEEARRGRTPTAPSCQKQTRNLD